MNRQFHDAAQALSAQAVSMVRERRFGEARAMYAKAADLEAQALATIGEDTPRTLGIIAVSAVSLMYKARRLEDAEQLLHETLARRAILPPARKQLRELLATVLDEQTLPAGFEYTGDKIVFSLRGGPVGHGTAPFDLVIQKASEMKNVVARTAEWRRGLPFRRSGVLPAEIAQMVEARAEQPAQGSYRIALRLAQPMQPDLFQDAVAGATEIAETVFAFAKLACSESPTAVEDLKALVPDDDYRRLLLRLLKNLLPSPGGPEQVELVRGIGVVEGEQRTESVRFVRDHRGIVAGKLRVDRPPLGDDATELLGTLRALHLDRNWLEIAEDGGKHVVCSTPRDVLDDVVGPMVNHRVRVIGTWPVNRTPNARFRLTDIDLAPQAQDA